MRRFRIRRGRNLVIEGRPEQVIHPARPVRSVAVLGRDYPSFRPRVRVEAGERVRLGQVLFEHPRFPTLVGTAPAAGVVVQIQRGARRALVAIEIELEGAAQVEFPRHTPAALQELSPAAVAETLLRTGLWTALRVRPFGHVPAPTERPPALFVTAMDTRPLAPAVDVIVEHAYASFHAGLAVLRRLTAGSVYLCTAPDSKIEAGDTPGIEHATFAGPHPAGLPGTHMHYLAPVDLKRPAWHVGYQDVIAIGHLFTTGGLAQERIVALGGPGARRPRLLRTRLGASLSDLLQDEVEGGAVRIISGSALHGQRAEGAVAFLGRYDDQITLLPEGPARQRGSTALMHGEPTTMVPVMAFEGLLPFDTLPVPLLRALLAGDTETARALGCLELGEEDLSLCTYACPSKQDYGLLLRGVLERIEQGG